MCDKHLNIKSKAMFPNMIKLLLTEGDSHQCPGYPSAKGIGKHPDYLVRSKTMDSPLMESVYHQLRAKSMKNKNKIDVSRVCMKSVRKNIC